VVIQVLNLIMLSFDFTLSFANSTKKEGLTTESQLRQSTELTVFDLLIDYTNKKNWLGWFESSDIIIGKEIEILQNDLTGKYSINEDDTYLTARYYWSYSDNQAFFTLQDDGALSQHTTS
jgi:hypothetical protein